MPAASRLAISTAILVAAGGFAQVQVDDRPKPIETGPLTKEELNRKKADELLRDARAHFAVGILHQRFDKLIGAVSTLEKALALDPDSLEVRRALVPLYVAVGRETEAMSLCKHVYDRDPHDSETAFQYARLLRADGRPAEAIAVLEQGVAGKDAQGRPDRLLHMLASLSDLLEKKRDFPGMAKTQESMVRAMIDHREQLLYGNGLTREDLQANLGRAYERLGQARVQTREYDRAAAAFRATRDTLLHSEDPEARHQAVRIHLNLSEIAAAQGRWSEALDALDVYLQHSPTDVGLYRKKVELLRKLDREADVVPAVRKHAARDEYNLGLQLLLAEELAKSQRTRTEAERIYTTLLEKNIKPEVYRGLFQLYRLAGDATKAIDMLDKAYAVAADDEAKADERETAGERGRAMLAVLRSDPNLVETLIRDARAELTRGQARQVDTWMLLASLAGKTRKLSEAEAFFRQCLPAAPRQQQGQVYSGLIQVLMLQKKYGDVVSLCRNGLEDPRIARSGMEMVIQPALATALAAQGKYDDALVHADRAIRLSSDDRKVNHHCRKAHILAQAGRYDEAVSECQETLKEFTRTTQVIEVRYTLSNVFTLKGDHAKSEEQLRLVLETDPVAPLANNNLGYQMADRNVNLDEAEQLIRRAIEAERSVRRELDDGENAAYLDSLGWVLFRKGKFAEAREWLEKAAALPDGADDPTVWDHLGDVYARLDMPAKAKEAWRTSMKQHDAAPPRKGDTRRAEVEKKLKSLDRQGQ